MRYLLLITSAAALLTCSAYASADIVNVSDAASLTTAINNAQAGDEIVLANGSYNLTGANCTAAGTATQPIIVRAAQPLGATIAFDGLEGFKVSGAHWHFEDLDISGVCADHNDCEHAFHVFGAAHGFWLRRSRVKDFNAQLKVNVGTVNGTKVAPDDGLIEGCDIGDSQARQTSAPVTKL
ncbi:MAG TPA: PE-PGRS family protein, partial [Sorangium sp.]|nr:PE-PGRS family protein [Sorangium sp.]